MTEVRNVLTHLLVEPYTFVWTLLLLGFIVLTVDEKVGVLYSLILLAGWAAYEIYGVKYTFNSTAKNTGQALFLAGVFFIIFIFSTIVITSFLQGLIPLGTTPGFNAILRHLEATTPMFANSPFWTWIVWGVLIPRIETLVLIGYLMLMLAKMFNVVVSLSSPMFYFILFIMSVVGVVYHFQVRGIKDNVALLITFIFWFISGMLIAYTKEMESATYLHIANNSLVVARNVGWLAMIGVGV